MTASDDREAAAVFDFIDEYLSDLDTGSAKPLGHYLARFRGHEEAIAREYLTLRGEERAHAGAAQAPVEEDARRIGHYRLLRELGRGGQGSVWLAEDVRIARKVALKVLASRFESVSEDRRRRFRREAEVIARLEHPSICPIYDADIECDTPWIAMRFVEGRTLAQVLGEARAEREEDTEAADARAAESARHDSQDSEVTSSWPPTSTLDVNRTLLLFERCARALHAAHEAGVIHRDVKPGNLIVTPDGKPVILDFGLARDEESTQGPITESGEVFGTPAYMSPEQLGGPSEELDRRTDVYSLGVALYEALTLKRPFEKGGNKAALYAAIKDEPPPDPRKENDALSLDVKVVLDTALEKDRTRRYRSALELAEDLRRIREYEPIHARPASVPLKLGRWIRRHPALAVSLIGTIVVLAVGLTVALVLNLQLTDALTGKSKALEVALGNHLAQRARALTREDPSAALTLGIQAVEKAPSDLTREALVEALEACRLHAVLAPSQQGRKPGRLRDLALSPMGERIALACETGVIELYDAQRFEPAGTIAGNGAPTIALAWLPDDRALIAAYADGRVAAWDRAKASFAVERQLDLVPTGLELDAGGRALLVVGAPANARPESTVRVLRVLDPATLEVRASVDALPEPIEGARFLPAGDRVLVWNRSTRVLQLRSATDGSVLARCAEELELSAVDVDPAANPPRIAIGTRGGAVCVLDEHLARVATIDLGREESVDLVRVRGERLFAATRPSASRRRVERGPGGRAFLVHARSKSAHEIALDAGARVSHAAFAPDGARVAFADEDNRLHVVEIASLAHERIVMSGFLLPAQLAWSVDGRVLVTRSNGPFAQVWYAFGAPGTARLSNESARARAAVLAPDGRFVATASFGGPSRLWRFDGEALRMERDLGSVPGPDDQVRGGGASSGTPPQPIPDGVTRPDLAYVAGAFARSGARLWVQSDPIVELLSVPVGERALGRVEGAQAFAKLADVAASGETDVIAALYDDGSVQLLLAGRTRSIELECSRARPPFVVGLTLDAAGARLALCTDDGRVTIVETTTQRVLRVLQDPRAKGVIATPAFRPGSNELAVFGKDNRVRFWDVETGERVRTDAQLFDPRSIAYSRDGKYLLATGRTGGGAVRAFELDPFMPVNFKTFHKSALTAGEFSDDARFVLTASRDGSVFVRETTTGKLFARRVFDGLEVVDAHFGGPVDELAIVAVTSDGAVHVWPVDPLPVAKRRFVRELDTGEDDRERKLAFPLEYRGSTDR